MKKRSFLSYLQGPLLYVLLLAMIIWMVTVLGSTPQDEALKLDYSTLLKWVEADLKSDSGLKVSADEKGMTLETVRITQNTLIALNIADDYFKAREKAEDLEEELQAKDKELYDIKHEFIQTQMKLESTSKTLESLQQSAAQDQKRIIQLETMLNQSKNRK